MQRIDYFERHSELGSAPAVPQLSPEAYIAGMPQPGAPQPEPITKFEDYFSCRDGNLLSAEEVITTITRLGGIIPVVEIGYLVDPTEFGILPHHHLELLREANGRMRRLLDAQAWKNF